jgi:hypothetical protein
VAKNPEESARDRDRDERPLRGDQVLLNIYVTEDERLQLKLEAVRLNRSMSDIVREGIELWWVKHRREQADQRD